MGASSSTYISLASEGIPVVTFRSGCQRRSEHTLPAFLEGYLLSTEMKQVFTQPGLPERYFVEDTTVSFSFCLPRTRSNVRSLPGVRAKLAALVKISCPLIA